MKALAVHSKSGDPFAINSTVSPAHSGSMGMMLGLGGVWMFTSKLASTGSKHPVGSVTVKMTSYDPGPGKVWVGSYSVLTWLSSKVQR